MSKADDALATEHTDPRLRTTLRETFGIEEFRPGQRDAVEALLAGRDLLAVMPTGAGKSLCFQLPAVMRDGLTLVISPLIALMKDQVDALRQRGVRAGYLASSQTPAERSEVQATLRSGGLDLLYVSPERLGEGSFLNLLSRLNVWLVAVDEAHCISAWGIDFRPDYLRIPDAIEKMRSRPVLAAFTATATPEVREDLAEHLHLENPERILAGFDRPNIRFLAQYSASQGQRIERLLAEVQKRSGGGIIYAGTRKATEEQAEAIQGSGRSAIAYHAGLSAAQRTEAQEQFLRGEIDVIVATNAFGMGIDKPDVRFVIHTNIPSSPEAYYQEAGRAGRDGKPADALLLYTDSDRGLGEWMIQQDLPTVAQLGRLFNYVKRGRGMIDIENAAERLGSEQVARVGLQVLAQSGLIELGERAGAEQLVTTTASQFGPQQALAVEQGIAAQRNRRLAQLDAMIAYANASHCRREALLKHFGDPAAKPGGNATCCDICADPDARNAGDMALLKKARRLLGQKRLSKARTEIRDALAETGNVRAAANRLQKSPKDVGDQARKLVAEGHLDIDALVPASVQADLAEACRRMDEAGVDYRRPRPGYLQSAMRFCPPDTDWDHLALYLAHVRRQEALEEVKDIDLDDLKAIQQERSGRRSAGGSAKASSDTVAETLERFRAGLTPAEIAEERGLKPQTIENHLVTAIRAGKLDLHSLIDEDTVGAIKEAIERTPVSDTPLRDIRETARQITGEDFPYIQINAVRAAMQAKPQATDGGELAELQQRKARAEQLRAEYQRSRRPWPSNWETEYQRINARIDELAGKS